jgi:Mn-containing catalase
MQGPWNSGEQWERLDLVEENLPLDGGEGTASVKLKAADKKTVEALAERTMSNPEVDALTGADLGAGPGAGTTTPRDE